MGRYLDIARQCIRQEPPPAIASPTPESPSTDWAADARKVIAALTDPTLRSDLTDHFEETAAALEYDQARPRQTAEMLAFGELLTEILRRGIDVRTATRAE